MSASQIRHVRSLSTAATSDTSFVVPKPQIVTKYMYNHQPRTVDTERSDEVTHLVDRLFERTREFMTTTTTTTTTTTFGTTNHHQNIPSHDKDGSGSSIPQFYHHTVAYSGGIDSSLVAAVVYQVSLDLNGDVSGNCSSTDASTSAKSMNAKHKYHNVTAVLGISPAVSLEQIQQAEDVALHIGISFVKIPTEEGNHDMYIANNGQACFACKSELYTKLIHHTIANYSATTVGHRSEEVASMLLPPSQSSSSSSTHGTHLHKLYNGTNADDCSDPTRVGLIAASQKNVLSPLSTFSKEQVRQMAKRLGLPNWNVASNPCLRSRLAIGIPATKQHLQRIERAERFIRQQLNDMISVETNLRVRLLAQQRGCLEIDDELVAAVTDLYHTNQSEWDQVLLNDLQFRSWTIRSFRSGSVAATVESLTISNESSSVRNALLVSTTPQ